MLGKYDLVYQDFDACGHSLAVWRVFPICYLLAWMGS